MVTAIVGVSARWTAPLLAQRMSDRRAAHEGAAAELRRGFDERRTAYTAMNRASREFDTALKDALHRLRDNVYGEQDRAEVETLQAGIP